MGMMKKAIKTILLPRGLRPWTIRGGALQGLRFHLDLHRDTQVWRGIYEQALQEWLTEQIAPDAICFDVGAAEGWATLLMARLAPQGRVFAFEPSTRGEWIARNLGLNRGIPQAEAELESRYVAATSRVDELGNQFVSLDDYCAAAGITRIDVLKIDVDGPELEVLDGAEKTISRHRPAICVEAHSRDLCEGVLGRLRKHDYRLRVVEPPPHEYRPLEYNPHVFGAAE